MNFIFSLVLLAFSSLSSAAPLTASSLEIYQASSWVENVARNGDVVSNMRHRNQEKLVVRSKDGKVLFETKSRLYAWSPKTAFSLDSRRLYFIERDRDVLMMASSTGETILGDIAIDSSVFLSEIIPTENPDLFVLRYAARNGYSGDTAKIALFSVTKAGNISVLDFKPATISVRLLNSDYLVVQTRKGSYYLYEMTSGGLISQSKYIGPKEFDFVELDSSPLTEILSRSSTSKYSTVLGYVDEPRINQPMKVGIWNLRHGPASETKSVIVELPYRYKYGSYPAVEMGFLINSTEAVVLVALEGEKKLVKVNFSTGQIAELLTSYASDGQYGMNHQSKAFWFWDTVARRL